MSTSTWTGAVSSDWDDADNWSPAGIPDASSDVTIASGTPLALASASIGTVNSITDSSDLRFRSAGTNTVTTFLDNSGELRVDRKGGAGGTILNIAGALTNSGNLVIGNATLSAPDEVTAASLDNTGKIYLTGSSADQALLDVAGSAGFGTAGVLSGYVRLAGDTAIEFASGEITSLAAGSHLGLIGNDAVIEDSTATGSNSALTGLASIGAGALFALRDGAAVSTTGALANDGNVYLDTNAGDGGSSLTVGGTLSNSQNLIIGNATLSGPTEVRAASISNSVTGSILLIGSKTNQALLDVTGALSNDGGITLHAGSKLSVAGTLTNDGAVGVIHDSEKLAGAVVGTGNFDLINATLQFDSSVSAGQTIEDLGGAVLLALKEAQNFAATIYGFGTNDTIDATNFLETATSYNFVENFMGTGGTLTLTDTSQSLTANIQMTGDYSNKSFTLAPDSGTGTLVKFV